MLQTPLGFAIDLSFWQNFFSWPFERQAVGVFAMVLWWLVGLEFFKAGVDLWLKYRQKKYIATLTWVVLAVDIPALFIQTPRAMEQVFVHLSGSLPKIKIVEKYWLGKVPKWFSFEIISIEGYIQFLVRTEIEFRDLVEAAIYAQYAEAEITEVEDYVDSVPDHFPNEEYDAVGAEFALAENEAYPIRTYPDFQYTISKDVTFSDPMAALLENFTRVGPGEQFWMHLIIVPSDNSWKKAGIDFVKKIISGKKEIKNTFVQAIGDAPIWLAKNLIQAWNADSGGDDKKKKDKKEDPVGKVSDLSPGNRAVVEAIENKIAKYGFKSRLRAVYVARKEVFAPSKCLNGFIGALNQFMINNRNGFVPKGGKGDKFIEAAKRRNLKFKSRKLKIMIDPFILNIEELATLWHFPLPSVKAPLVQKTSIKRGEPPTNLPVEIIESALRIKPITPTGQKVAEESATPEELPYA